MKAYGQYCPIARGSEIFAERWTPIIVRNLLVGCTTFDELREGALGIPRSLLSSRLRQLERCGVLVRRTDGRRCTYRLTDCGVELAAVCHALGVWGARWLETSPGDLDAHLALWFWSRLVDGEALPDRTVVVRFDLTDTSRPNRYWVLLAPTSRDVCIKPPGPAEDLVVTTDTASLIRWHTGVVSLGVAKRSGAIRIEGPPALVRAFPRWGGLSPFAGVAPATQGAAGRS